MGGLELDICIPEFSLAISICDRSDKLWYPSTGKTLSEFISERDNNKYKMMLCRHNGYKFICLHGIDGATSILRKAIPHMSFRRLPHNIIEEWDSYRKSKHTIIKHGLAFKIKHDGKLIPVNRESADWLKNNIDNIGLIYAMPK
ncbi:MAG: hypothetical protein QXP41_00515 [Candidatus Nitrosocaldus sp.]